MRQWVKWHTKVLTEPKVIRMTDKQFRVFANLIALAGYLDNEDGRLGPSEDIALHLHLSTNKTRAAMDDLCAIGIVIQQENVWFLKNWDEYNGKPPSDRKENVKERVDRFREKQAQNETGNASVTPLQPDGNEPRVEKNREEKSRGRVEESNGAGAPPPPPKKTAAKKTEHYPAVETFREAAGAYPVKALWVSMHEAIGSAPDDLEFWRQVVHGWIVKGWNPRNLSGMFDFYKRRELPTEANGRRAGNLSPAEQLLAYTQELRAHGDTTGS